MIDFRRQDIRKLETEFGIPLYVFDEAAFIHNYFKLETALRQYYPKYRVSYSFKTNYTPYMCSVVNRLGGYAEVVSGMEYDIAKRVGFAAEKIIFNGPNKGEDGVKALLDGCIVNVDNFDELDLVCRIVNEHPETKFEIGLRVNIDVGQTFISRFGMDTTELDRAFEIVDHVDNLEVVGLHCHISRCRGVDVWRERTRVMLELSDRYFSNRQPKYIDLGSGMFGEMDAELKAQFGVVPSYDDYAEATTKQMAEHYSRYTDHQKPVLFTEPGTTLINKYVDFIGRVDAIKSIKGKTFAILNCSEHNLGETCTLKKLPVKVVHSGPRSKYYKDVDLVGYTCLEQDVMYAEYSGYLAPGDYVQFGNVGGYSNVYKPPFIWPNCAMVVKKETGEYQVIKRKESYADILHTYAF
ncbi:MAG: diaminopimelate decarboxylase [Clostridia bacterium]|nr:diaminopimelate decarboxylase [Clostridia bacterium]